MTDFQARGMRAAITGRAKAIQAKKDTCMSVRSRSRAMVRALPGVPMLPMLAEKAMPIMKARPRLLCPGTLPAPLSILRATATITAQAVLLEMISDRSAVDAITPRMTRGIPPGPDPSPNRAAATIMMRMSPVCRTGCIVWVSPFIRDGVLIRPL